LSNRHASAGFDRIDQDVRQVTAKVAHELG